MFCYILVNISFYKLFVTKWPTGKLPAPPKWCPREPKHLQGETQEAQRPPQGIPKASKIQPKMLQNIVNNDVFIHCSKSRPFRSKVVPRTAPGPPKWCPREPQDLQGEPQEAQRPPKGTPKASKRYPKSTPRDLWGPILIRDLNLKS